MHLAPQTHISLFQHWAVLEQISFAEVVQMIAALFEMAVQMQVSAMPSPEGCLNALPLLQPVSYFTLHERSQKVN